MAFGGLKGNLSVAANSITATTSATGSVVVAVGDLVYAVIGEQTGNTTTACGDNLGNGYTALSAGTLSGSACSGHAYYSRVTVAGTLTSVNFTCTGSANNVSAIAAVIEGPFAVAPLDANPANITSDVTSPFTGPATGTLTQPNEVVLSWGVANYGTVWTATSPNLLVLDLPSQTVVKLALGYQLVAATTSVAPVFAAAGNPSAAVSGTSSFKGLQTWSYVTSYSGSTFGSQVTITVTLNAGDSVNVWVEVGEDTANTVSVTDNASPSTNTYSSGTKFVLNSAFNIFPLYAINIPHSATTLTVTYSGTANIFVCVDQYTGEGAATLNAQASRSQVLPGTATNAVSASTTSIGASNDRNCAFTYSNTQIGTIAAGTGYTGRFASGGIARTEDKFGAGTGSFTASSASDNFMSLMMTFTPSGAPILGTFAGSAAGGIAVGAIEREVATATLSASGALVATSPPAFSVTFTDTRADAGGANPVTYNSGGDPSIGAANATRIVVVCPTGRISSSSGPTAVTIAGVSATHVTNAFVQSNSTVQVDAWYAAVPTGTTATVVVTFAVTPNDTILSVWSVIGSTLTPTSAVTAAGASGPGGSANLALPSITVPTGGTALATYVSRNTDPAGVSWTNATSDYNLIAAGTGIRDFGGGHTTGTGSVTITATDQSPVADPASEAAVNAVAWGPGTGATTWQGAASLSGSGVLTAPAIERAVAAVVLPASGVLTAAAIETAIDTAVLSASGVLSATAFPGQFVAPVLSGSGVLTAAAVERAIDTAVLSASGVLTAAAIERAVAAAVLSASGALSATAITGGTVWQGVSALSGSGVLTAAAIEQAVDTAVLSASGVLSAAAIERALGTASLSGSGVLTAAAIERELGSALLSASGVLTATPFAPPTGFVLKSWTTAVHGDGSSLTTGNIDTTGADLLVAVTWYYFGFSAPAITDSKGNNANWTVAIANNPGNAAACNISYVQSPIVGTGHNFTMTPAGNGGIIVAAFSGSAASPLDRTDFNDSFSSTVGSGSVTPSQANELVITGVGAPNVNDTLSVDSGFVIPAGGSILLSLSSPNAYGGGLAYLIETAAVSASTTWTVSTGAGNSGAATAIATFKASSGPPPPAGSFVGAGSGGLLSRAIERLLASTSFFGVGALGAAAASASAPPFSLTFTDTRVDSSGANPITYNAGGDPSIGAAAATRIVVVCPASRVSTASSVVSVTIAGVTATQVSGAFAQSNSVVQTDAWYAAVPTGTTATVVVNWAVAPGDTIISVWRIVGSSGVPTAAVAAAAATGPGASANLALPAIAVPAGGAALCTYFNRTTDVSGVSWTNATADYNTVVNATRDAGGAHTTSTGLVAITATDQAPVTELQSEAVGNAVAWGPPPGNILAASGGLLSRALGRALAGAILRGEASLGTPDLYLTDENGNIITDENGNPIVAVPGVPPGAVIRAVASAILSASGQLVVTAVPPGVTTWQGVAVLSGSGVLTAAAIERALGTAPLAASGVLTAVGIEREVGAAVLSASGVLATAALEQVIGSAVLQGSGVLSAVGSSGAVTWQGVAALAASGVLTAAAIEQAIDTAVLSGSGVLTAAAIERALGTASLAGSGVLSAVGSVGAITWPGIAALSGSGALTAAAVLQEVGSAVLSGSGLLTTAGFPVHFEAPAFSASGVLTAAAIKRAVGAAVLSASGVLTETTIERVLARALLSASGQLIAIARSKSERPPPPPARLTIRGYPAVPLWQVTSPQTWSARLGDILKTVRQGKQNITLPVTLATGVTTTIITDVRISAICGIVLVPTTAHAVAIQSSVYVSAQKSGEATLTHSSTANTDCNFTVVLIG